jgi:hypothetical protein
VVRIVLRGFGARMATFDGIPSYPRLRRARPDCCLGDAARKPLARYCLTRGALARGVCRVAAFPPRCGHACDSYATAYRDLIPRWTYSTRSALVLARPVRFVRGSWVMSSYAQYCQDQATACARRGGLASSPEIVAYCRNLELRWRKLAQQAHKTGGALAREGGQTATLAPLHDKPAPCSTEYARRAGELIARSARSLHRLGK